MKIIVASTDLPEIVKIISEKDAKSMKDRWGHYPSANNGKLRIEISKFSEESLKALRDFLEEKGKAGDRSSLLSRGQVQQWIDIKSNPGGNVVTRLEAVASAMKEYISTGENRYVFEQLGDGNMVPWLVVEIKYVDSSVRAYVSQHVEIKVQSHGDCENSSHGDSKTFSVNPDDYRGRTMSQILERLGLYLETPNRMESYGKELEKWKQYAGIDGFQMSVTGKARIIGGWYNTGYRHVGHDGSPAKMVVDPKTRESDESAIPCKFWDENDSDDDTPSESTETLWTPPIQPILRMFDLSEHEHYAVHVNSMEPYVYDKNVGSKLVLPPEVKDFIGTLIEHSGEVFEDIVQGKSGGTIVLIEGEPGIGKTLTAEVYSEVMERPLYKVQSSQLGTDAKSLEGILGKILERATRWGAILLIDEADVYIYERGRDIGQNAVVGVFLRVLEYYRGVLFMTTNRGTSVDDAIISRLTARLEYQMPSKEDQAKLWDVLSKQNGISIDKAEIDKVLELLPDLSGRDIKNLLKLGFVMARKNGGKVTADILKYVSRFKQSRSKEVQS